MKNISLKIMPLLLTMFLVMCNDDNYQFPSDVKEGSEPNASFLFVVDFLDVHFTNTSIDAESYYWDFGDGTSSTEQSPIHTYSSAGTYTVTLKVNSPAGYSSTTDESLFVAGEVSAFYQFKAQKYREGGFGRVIDFDATASENAVSIVWDFGDGVVIEGTDFAVTHEFPDFGVFKVKITTTGLLGDIGVYETDLEVVPYLEMLKGGSMEESDAAYWKIKGTGYPVQFGYTADGPSGGEGGCLRFVGRTAQGSYTTAVYQAVDVVEGEKFEISAQMKWGANGYSNGVLFWCIAGPAGSADFEGDGVTPKFTDSNLFISSFNDWDPGTPIPAYDSDLSGYHKNGDPYGKGYSGQGRHRSGGTYGVYTAPVTGRIYLGVELRLVWGNYFTGDFYFDEISMKLIPD